MTAVGVLDGIKYGFVLLGYFVAVFVVGAVLIGIGGAVGAGGTGGNDVVFARSSAGCWRSSAVWWSSPDRSACCTRSSPTARGAELRARTRPFPIRALTTLPVPTGSSDESRSLYHSGE